MIYILGNGYVGQAYAKYFLINSIPHKVVTRKEVLYTNPINLATFLATAKPSLLINAAGYVGQPNVDACEDHKLACMYGNAVLPGFIGEICQGLNIPWIHVSSGCVYDGFKRVRKKDIRPIDIANNPLLHQPLLSKEDNLAFIHDELAKEAYTEEDVPNFTFRDQNSSFYSGSKAMGEEIIKKYKGVYVCRLRMPFNEDSSSRNYLTKLATYEKILSASNSITQIDEFIKATYDLWVKQAPYGIYNVTNPGYAEVPIIIQKLLKAGIRKSEPTWVTTEEFNSFVRTPRSNCLLNSDKLTAITPLTDVNEAIDKAIANWNA